MSIENISTYAACINPHKTSMYLTTLDVLFGCCNVDTLEKIGCDITWRYHSLNEELQSAIKPAAWDVLTRYLHRNTLKQDRLSVLTSKNKKDYYRTMRGHMRMALTQKGVVSHVVDERVANASELELRLFYVFFTIQYSEFPAEFPAEYDFNFQLTLDNLVPQINRLLRVHDVHGKYTTGKEIALQYDIAHQMYYVGEISMCNPDRVVECIETYTDLTVTWEMLQSEDFWEEVFPLSKKVSQ